MRILSLMLAASLLTGCAAFNRGDGGARLAPPPSLTMPCADPVRLPDRALSDQEIEVLWGRDRAALRACEGRHGALAAHILNEGTDQ